MKKLTFLFAVLGLLLFSSPVWASLAFYDCIDFAGSGTYDGEDYTLVTDYTYYVHDLGYLDPPIDYINDATLSIKHAGNNDLLFPLRKSELWIVFGYANPISNFLGLLGRSVDDQMNPIWRTDSFVLDDEILDKMGNHDWQLKVNLADITPGSDYLYLGKSELAGNYNPAVPEPGTLMLLGSSLLGLGAFGFRRRK